MAFFLAFVLSWFRDSVLVSKSLSAATAYFVRGLLTLRCTHDNGKFDRCRLPWIDNAGRME
jgi:hypothetical protein